ncbi:hypothetical protein PRUPE_5G202100 [Prunus persica]|uniref:Uncharacterized protein n=1 Tax=Prunus persica TaxID=3760 RepID=M5WF20_PRUPE|nr:hypothetical protein PRUPE_5G202100 [Prunus persica]
MAMAIDLLLVSSRGGRKAGGVEVGFVRVAGGAITLVEGKPTCSSVAIFISTLFSTLDFIELMFNSSATCTFWLIEDRHVRKCDHIATQTISAFFFHVRGKCLFVFFFSPVSIEFSWKLK